MRSEALKLAWAYIKAGVTIFFGEAQRLAWKELKVKSALRKGWVKVRFEKISTGEEVERIATLNRNNYEYSPKGERKIKIGTVVYWEKDKGFRSFKIEKFRSFEPIQLASLREVPFEIINKAA